ncbi:MAG: cupin domain-containing protein [Wenzhouxiangellaceae bacterium]
MPLSVPGTPLKFNNTFSWEALSESLLAGKELQNPEYMIRAVFTQGEASGSSRRMIAAYYDQLAELLQSGATICITNIHLADQYLREWAGAIRSQMRFTGNVGVNCYISPDGSGFPIHYDGRVATTLQIAGSKRWTFSTETAKRWPAHNAAYRNGRVEANGVEPGNAGKPPADMTFKEVTLNPGDLLSLPAGTWHSARAVDHSLALNLYFEPRNFLDDLIPLLRDFTTADSNWISGPPVTVETLDGPIPETVSAYIRKRLDEFNKAARNLSEDPDVLAESWMKSFTHNSGEHT